MKSLLKTNINKGLSAGIILIFLSLIGFVKTISKIFGGWFNSNELIGFAFFLVVFGLIIGRSAVTNVKENDWKSNIQASLITGISLALIMVLLVVIVGSLKTANISMRSYLPNLSPAFSNLLLFETDSTLLGILINFVLIAGAVVGGGALAKYLSEFDLKGKISSSDAVGRTKEFITNIRKQSEDRPIIKYGLIGLAILMMAIIPMMLNESWNLNLGTIGIYILMGIGLNLVVGTAGLLDLGFVAFYAIGAYTVGLLTAPKPLGIMMEFWPAFFIGIIVAILFGFLIGIPVVRLRGDYLAIVTLGFGEITRVLIQSDTLEKWTGGPQGVKDIAQPILLGIPIDSKRAYLYIILIFIILAFFITNRLQYSRIGRAWIAMREDETVAEAMGINTFKYKLLAFMIGASFAGIAGGLFAARNFFTGPADHTLMVSINVLSEIIVGGLNSIGGIITGAFVLKGLPEILRQVEGFRMVTFGALLVVMMIWKPEGLWPSKRKNIFEGKQKSNDQEES